MDAHTFKAVLAAHKLWLADPSTGQCADLLRADLRGADLRGADLRGADLRYCIGNSREIKTLQTSTWPVVYTKDTITIGCQQHSIEAWFSFEDATISTMDDAALEWWRVWKPRLMDIIFN